MQPAEQSQQPPSKAERYREIVGTLARHGIGVVGEQFGKDEEDRDRTRAARLRAACEELGTTFIKLGQALSTRGDLLPEPYRVELMKLQDDVPPVDAAEIEAVIEEDLGAAPDRIFAWFDPVPLACASIGQVHAARLADGRDVVVKVRKPGVEHVVDVDLEIVNDLVESWSPRLRFIEEYDVRGLVREFGDRLRDELDYEREAVSVARFREMFDKQRGFAIPEVIGPLSTKRVLTLTRLDGLKPSECEGVPKRRRAAIARRIGRFVLEPAFSLGIFHADPHAGNFLIQPDGSLVVVDFGMIGTLTPDARRRVADIFIAMQRHDVERLTDRLIDITGPSRPIDRAAFTGEVNRMLERYVGESLEDMRIGDALTDLLDLIRRYALRLPGNLALLFKALVMCEGLVESMDPESTLAQHLEPIADKLVHGRFTDEQWLTRMRDSATDAAELSVELPRRLDRVMGDVERGNIRVWTRVEDMEQIMTRFERTVERANATMLASACIVGLSIVMLFYHPQGWERWIGAIFWLGVTIAFLIVLRTVWGTLSKKRRDLR